MHLRNVVGALLAAVLLPPVPAAAAGAPAPAVVQETPDDPPIPADGAAPVTTDSGLVYSVLEPGPADGAHPAVGDMVRVHYTGWLEDGTVFDSSRVERAPGMGVQPAEFRVGRVIPGWNEGLELMTPGARYKLTIPSDLAYGDTGSPPTIPPGATLIFDVELLGLERGPQLPEFRRVGEDAQELDNGVRYRVVEAAEGPAPEGSQMVKLDYYFWSPDGELIDCAVWAENPIRCTASNAPPALSFLTELMGELGEGAELLLEVPDPLFGKGRLPGVSADEPTVWLVRTLYVAYPPELPAFRRVGEDAATLADSGARYEILAEGAGEPVGTDQKIELAFTYWNAEGELIDSTRNPGRGPLPATVDQLIIPFMKELVPNLAPGAVALVELSAGSAFQGSLPPGLQPDDTVVWRLEVVSRLEPLPVPEFRLPDPESSVTTDSGLVIETLEAGDGPTPRRDQRARVHYAGWLAADGTLFDNSFERGVPSEFGLTQVIPGWTETLLRMQVGERVLVRIPWIEAYGASGKPPSIPAKADLVFQVELLGLEE